MQIDWIEQEVTEGTEDLFWALFSLLTPVHKLSLHLIEVLLLVHFWEFDFLIQNWVILDRSIVGNWCKMRSLIHLDIRLFAHFWIRHALDGLRIGHRQWCNPSAVRNAQTNLLHEPPKDGGQAEGNRSIANAGAISRTDF